MPSSTLSQDPLKFAFLDRDGIINKNAPNGGYVLRPKQFHLDGVIDFLSALSQMNYQLIVITNQQGIGRGLMTEQDLDDVHAVMHRLLNEGGISIEGTYHCPHLASTDCDCRKPKPGLFIRAAQEHTINLNQAIFIGDSLTDAEAGKAARVRTFLIDSPRLHDKTLQGKSTLLAKDRTDGAEVTIVEGFEQLKNLLESDQ
jgi:D-glycero-D-manno-heptose 1,7-bisphosphate phosphatase